MIEKRTRLTDIAYLKIIKIYADSFSKCQFTKVGAMAVNVNGRIIATGVNGTLPGDKNCCDVEFEHREDHVKFTKENELHAEANLLLELTRNGFSSDMNNAKQITVYLTISPCEECLKLLLGTCYIRRIVCLDRYHRTTDEQYQHIIDKCDKYMVEFVNYDGKLE